MNEADLENLTTALTAAIREALKSNWPGSTGVATATNWTKKILLRLEKVDPRDRKSVYDYVDFLASRGPGGDSKGSTSGN